VGAEVEDTGPRRSSACRARVRVESATRVTRGQLRLKAKLAGDATVISRPGDIVRATVRSASSKASTSLRQFVRITRGVLSYNRTPLDEPTLDLVGEREIKQEDIVVWIHVRGTLAEPFITLSSRPAMSQNEALSTAHRALDQHAASRGDAASVDRARRARARPAAACCWGHRRTHGLDEDHPRADRHEDTFRRARQVPVAELFVSYGISNRRGDQHHQAPLHAERALVAQGGGRLEQAADIEYGSNAS